ncbi:MAG: hypothetical protein ABL888_03450 [Pirellulaceae bacterium]
MTESFSFDADDSPAAMQLRKRFIMNLLIQGAAAHTYVTAHRLVHDELELLSPGITKLYDKLAANLHLTQWQGDLFFFLGSSKKFWRTIDRPEHPFSRQPIFRKYGKLLSDAARKNIIARSREVRTTTWPGLHYANTYILLIRTMMREAKMTHALEDLCVQATTKIWGIERERLRGRLTTEVAFGVLQTPRTRVGKLLRNAAIGYGGVIQEGGRLQVEARAWVFPLLAHELTKGTAELVCLHGLNHLNDTTYAMVTDEADQLELEIWMIQAGGELWRRFLSAIPRDIEHDHLLAQSLMQVARL